MAIVLDVHPTDVGLHRLILREHFDGRVTLAKDVGSIKDQHHGRMIHLLHDVRQDVARLAHQVGFDFQAERQVRAVTGFGDLAQLVDGLRQMLAGSEPLGG